LPTASSAVQSGGFFGRLRARLNRGKSWLADDLLSVFATRLDPETLETLETELLLADVGVDATEWLLEQIQKGPRGQTNTSVRARLKATIIALLEPLELPLNPAISTKPFVILAVGVNGTGKTTSIGKLANLYKLGGQSVVLAAGDTFRAAAVEQLTEWGHRVDCPVISQSQGADPAAVIHDALVSARAKGADILIADTAGRLHTSAGLMDELDKIRRVAARFDPSGPHEILLVLDASQGQNALAQARAFHHRLGVTGLIITKLDGTAKGGIVLAIARELGLPIRFLAIGESLEDFAPFKADQFVEALLGEGVLGESSPG
jgi:fused signal recognition particle receptor